MKQFSIFFIVLLGFATSAFAGDSAKMVIEDPVYFDNVRRPVTNPTLFDTALPQTKLHAIMIHQTLPDFIDTTLGQLPVGGDLQVYAVQAELALGERFSLVAAKDGYIDFQPDATFSNTSGWANLSAGAKWAWLYRPENQVASAFQLLYEAPSGNRDVWQGEGDGQIIPSLFYLQSFNRLQYSNAFGFRLPVDGDAESSQFYTSQHIGYHLTDWLYPLIELNWFHVMDQGDGASRFPAQAGGITPAIARFEAGDLVNWGALNSGANDDLVTMAIGFRAEFPFLKDQADFGFAWEFPLTDGDATILDDRFTFSVELRY
ncbi:MAG: hypothetical protein AAGH89_16965 [Verrucomicrobiota bacterium]